MQACGGLAGSSGVLTCPLATVIAFSACARHMKPANANPRAWPAIHESPPQPHRSMYQFCMEWQCQAACEEGRQHRVLQAACQAGNG